MNIRRNFPFSIDFRVKHEFLTALCLLRSFPNLKFLEIDAVSGEGTHNNTTIPNLPSPILEVTFHQLLRMKVVDMTGTQQELLLLKFMLAGAPALQSLEMSTSPDKRLVDDSKIFIELMRYPRASSVAEVIYKEKIELTDFFY